MLIAQTMKVKPQFEDWVSVPHSKNSMKGVRLLIGFSYVTFQFVEREEKATFHI